MYILPKTSQSFHPTLEFATVRAGLLSSVSRRCSGTELQALKTVFSSSVLCCFLLPTNLLVILYSFLNRRPTTANQVSHILLLLLLFQTSFIYTGCLYRHKLILLPFSQKETNSFPPWHELTKVTGLRSQLSYAWGSAIKFQTSQIFKRSSSLKIQNYIFKAIQDILLYLLLCWEAEVPGSNTTLSSSSSLSSHRSPQSSQVRKAHSLHIPLILTARGQGRKMEGTLQFYHILPFNKT